MVTIGQSCSPMVQSVILWLWDCRTIVEHSHSPMVCKDCRSVTIGLKETTGDLLANLDMYADYLIYHGNSLRSSALLTSTPAQLGMNEKFLPSGFYQRRLPTSYNIKNYLTKPSINNNSTTDLWYLGVTRYVTRFAKPGIMAHTKILSIMHYKT